VKLFCVRDTKSKVAHTPFFQKTSTDALRGFQLAVNDEQTMLAKFPEDFVLMELATFNDESLALDVYTDPVKLARAIDYKQEPQKGTLI